ncbi:hypothetical protein EQV77_01365 [Halobacillus fulvus]|nr:hypothetical protein EQV77_01365 [Halobacillus fulvus]
MFGGVYVQKTCILLLFVLLSSAAWLFAPQIAKADEAIIEVDHLNVRTGPGTNYERVGQVHTNQSYPILAEQNNWLKIKWKNKEVWVAKWLTKVKQSSQVSTGHSYSKVDYLRIRSAPGMQGTVQGYLMKNDTVNPEKQQGSWVLIQKGAVKGWVHKGYLAQKASTPSQEPEKKEPESSTGKAMGKVKVGTAVLNVRSQNSTNGKILSKVYNGQVYDYIEEKNRWYLIRLNGGQTGWVAGWLVNKVNQTSTTPAAQNPSKVTLEYNGTNLRSGPSTTYRVIGSANKGQSFEVIEKQGQWYKIKYNNGTAFVAAWIVTETKGQNAPSSPALSGNLSGKTIVVDAGHGGRDPGAVGRAGSYEKTLTLSTAQTLKSHLESKGAKVLMTRSSDQYISLTYRSYYSNQSKADAFISVHYNSAPRNIAARGISSYYYHDQSKTLASSIQNAMIKSTGLRDRGIKHGSFYVIRNNNKPAVLLELGFVSDAREEQEIRTSSYQNRVSTGITNGLIQYFSR